MKVLKTAGRVLCVLSVGVFAGFMGFVFTIESVEHAPSRRADAIVALSGDRQRVRKAVDLLTRGYGGRLLITGIDNADEIARQYAGHQRLFECCVDVNQASHSTREDAAQTGRWVREHGLRSILVVTSNFHMRRTLIELDHTLPGVRKIPHPVAMERADLLEWWRNPRALKLIAGEYAKLVAAWLRTRVEPIKS